MQMIRVGVIGFGLAGRVFHAPLISSVDGLQLAAVLERSGNLAAGRYPGITTYRSLDEMLRDASLDLIVVASPSGTHFDVARQVIEAGKHIVVDKPVALHANEVAELIHLTRQRGVMLVPFHNRRWDGDFLTVQKVLQEGALGRLVYMESRMDRWNPGATRRPWKNDPEQGGGALLDLGTHLIYVALVLFGKPLGVSAEVDRERDDEGADDSFTIRLRYESLRVTLGSNMLSSPAGPRFVLRGAQGNFRKSGLDPQEAELNKITRIETAHWGEEPPENWGTLTVAVDHGMVTRPVETVPGDYRRFYERLRVALLGQAAPPVPAVEAWQAAMIVDWARQSSQERREISCDWDGEPA
jgi:predicted dehydrogenase